MIIDKKIEHLRECLEGIKFQRNIKFELIVAFQDPNGEAAKLANRLLNEGFDGQYRIDDGLIEFENEKFRFKEASQVAKFDNVAFCVSSQVWTNPNKLALQLDFLDVNRVASIVCTNFANQFAYDGTFSPPANSRDVAFFADGVTIIKDNLLWLFSTILVKRRLFEKHNPIFVSLNLFPYYLALTNAEICLCAFLPDICCVNYVDGLKKQADYNYNCEIDKLALLNNPDFKLNEFMGALINEAVNDTRQNLEIVEVS